MIDRETVDRIYAAANIVDIIGDYVTLKRKGVNYQACCPFHNEKTPSFVVSPSKGVYKCFGCGKGGNAVTFLMEHENITYPEALKMVAKRYGIEVREKELTEEEVRLITRFRRGEGLLCIGHNHVPISVFVSPKEYEAITTSPTDRRARNNA